MLSYAIVYYHYKIDTLDVCINTINRMRLNFNNYSGDVRRIFFVALKRCGFANAVISRLDTQRDLSLGMRGLLGFMSGVVLVFATYSARPASSGE